MSSLVPFNRNNSESNFFRIFSDDDFIPAAYYNYTFRSDVRETETAYILECELPGVERDDVTIDVDNGYLTITAHSREEKEEQEGNYLRRERFAGSVRRTFNVSNTKTDEITAKLSDGVLVVNLPKIDMKKNRNTKVDIQ